MHTDTIVIENAFCRTLYNPTLYIPNYMYIHIYIFIY